MKILAAIFLLLTVRVAAQNVAKEEANVTAYFTVLCPVLNWEQGKAVSSNFKNSFSILFPMGINIKKTRSTGFGLQIDPAITMQNGNSKVSSISIDPSVLFLLKHGYSIAPRLSFETSGRFGITPVFAKVIKTNLGSNYFVAIPVPFRFGNNAPASIGAGILLGIGF
jgi:hypothetical protein